MFVTPGEASGQRVERRAGREEVQRPVKRHNDKRAHSRETVVLFRVRQTHSHTRVETFGIYENHNKM